MKELLLAGGAGFIGTALAETAVAKGCHVTVVDDGSGSTEFNWARLHALPNTVTHRVSIQEFVADWDMEFDAVVNLACRKMQACADVRDAVSANATQAHDLAEAAAAASVRRYVHVSTGSVYGRKLASRYVTEDDVPEPVGLYACTKLLGEQLTRQALGNGPTDWAIARLFNVMGPGQAFGPGGGVLARWCAGVIGLDEWPALYGDGHTLRQVTDVHDVATTLLRMAFGEWHGIYNIGSANRVRLDYLYDEVRGVAEGYGVPAKDPLVHPARPGDLPDVRCCNQRSLDAGASYTADWGDVVSDAFHFYWNLRHASHD